MELILKVLSFKNQPITDINAVSIGDTGGSIGRSDDNTLVLPDTEKFVSRHHATISLENGCYYLSDTSLGGVYINNRETPLQNATERIDNGAILRIGEYEIAVAIVDDQVIDDFPFLSEPVISEPSAFLQADEPWLELGDVGFNSLMTDNFPSHEELVQPKTDEQPVTFESHLQGNQSPLFDSYIAPNINPPSSVSVITPVGATETIPEDFSFDDLFSPSDVEMVDYSRPAPIVDKPKVNDEFEDFFGAAINEMAAEVDQSAQASELLAENNHEAKAVEADDGGSLSFVIEPSLFPSEEMPDVAIPKADIHQEDDKINTEPVLVTEIVAEKAPPPVLADSVLFNAFLQGATVECNDISPEQQAETLHRIGRMFRKLVDGTVAVLRSRAEFKSLCRVSMTVIRAADNNPLKFTVSTDDVLRQLLENKTDGFLASTAAIEEGFDDIMNHQLAMQAGIQASLTDLLKTFDPKIIEKQFEQGIVLQKKAKCWDRYEETYRNTVEDAVENFFGEEFVKAYEKQMSLLTKSRGKRQDG